MLNARVVKLLDEKSSKASLRSTHDCLRIYFSSHFFQFNLEKVSPKVAVHAVCLKNLRMIPKVMKCEAIFCDNNKKKSLDYPLFFTDSLQKPHETKSSFL